VLLVTTLAFAVVVAPWLQATLPGLFPRPLVVPDRGELPRGRLGWLNLLVVVAMTGGFAYWRAAHTELGGEAWARVRAISDPTVEREDGE
jgi:hypothetical protein